jgi:hypothetical protein
MSTGEARIVQFSPEEHYQYLICEEGDLEQQASLGGLRLEKVT